MLTGNRVIASAVP